MSNCCHQNCKLEFTIDGFKDFISDYSELICNYSAIITYYKNSIVYYSTIFYKSKTFDNINNLPSEIGSEFWQEITDEDEILELEKKYIPDSMITKAIDEAKNICNILEIIYDACDVNLFYLFVAWKLKDKINQINGIPSTLNLDAAASSVSDGSMSVSLDLTALQINPQLRQYATNIFGVEYYIQSRKYLAQMTFPRLINNNYR